MRDLPPGRAGFFHLLRDLRDPYAATHRLFERYGDPRTVGRRASCWRRREKTDDAGGLRGIQDA